MLGMTMMSGERGSPAGGRPGLLNICRNPRPQKISPMPATLADAGDVVSSVWTPVSVSQELLSHNRETSSSVGPIWPPALDSESGKQLSRILLGEVVTILVDFIRT